MKGPAGGDWCRRMLGGMRGCGGYDATAIAILFVIGSIDDPSDLAPIEGSGAHETGFYGDVDGGVGKVFAAKEVEGGSEGDDLCVGGAIVEPFCLVVSAGDDLVAEDDDGADGDLLFGIGFAGFFEGLLHVVFVGHDGNKNRAISPYLNDVLYMWIKSTEVLPLLGPR